jgi:hypothetical protein
VKMFDIRLEKTFKFSGGSNVGRSNSHAVKCLVSGPLTAMARVQFPAWENSNSLQGMPFIPCFHSKNCVLVLLKFCYVHHFNLGAASNVAK